MWKIVCLTRSSLDEEVIKPVSVMVERFENIGVVLKSINAIIDEEHYVKIYFIGGHLK